MGIIDRLRQAINKSLPGLEHPTPIETLKPAEEQPKPPPKKSTKRESKKTAKDIATEQGEPYVAILSFELDPDNLNSGAFELDWNDKFIINLVRAGYQRQPNEPEHVIIDRWFQNICRHVVLETYEQEQADPEIRRITKRKLDNDRSEIS